MKPIYIEMKAFGSYRDEKIDFTGKSQGLFDHRRYRCGKNHNF